MLRFSTLFMLLTTCASAQSSTLSGLVMDGSAGVPLEGATVTLQDAGLVLTTDAKGHYSSEGDAAAAKEAYVSQVRLDGELSQQNGDRIPFSKGQSADVITFSKDGYGSASRNVTSTDGTENVVLTLEGKVTYVCTTADAKGRWQIARTVYDPETKTSAIAYQKWVDPDHDMYKGGVMVYAKFDASMPSITNEVIFDKLDPSTMAWYVSISTDNKFLLFAKDGAIMQHDVEKGTTMKVSADSDPYKAYPTYTTFSK